MKTLILLATLIASVLTGNSDMEAQTLVPVIRSSGIVSEVQTNETNIVTPGGEMDKKENKGATLVASEVQALGGRQNRDNEEGGNTSEQANESVERVTPVVEQPVTPVPAKVGPQPDSNGIYHFTDCFEFMEFVQNHPELPAGTIVLE